MCRRRVKATGNCALLGGIIIGSTVIVQNLALATSIEHPMRGERGI